MAMSWGACGGAMQGVYFLNTSYLAPQPSHLGNAGGDGDRGDGRTVLVESDMETWQYTTVTPTRMSNGSTIDVTRNYTYFVGAEKGSDGTQQLLR